MDLLWKFLGLENISSPIRIRFCNLQPAKFVRFWFSFRRYSPSTKQNVGKKTRRRYFRAPIQSTITGWWRSCAQRCDKFAYNQRTANVIKHSITFVCINTYNIIANSHRHHLSAQCPYTIIKNFVYLYTRAREKERDLVRVVLWTKNVYVFFSLIFFLLHSLYYIYTMQTLVFFFVFSLLRSITTFYLFFLSFKERSFPLLKWHLSLTTTRCDFSATIV